MYFVSFKHIRPDLYSVMSLGFFSTDHTGTEVAWDIGPSSKTGSRTSSGSEYLFFLFVPIFTHNLWPHKLQANIRGLGAITSVGGLAAEAGTGGPQLEFQPCETVIETSVKCDKRRSHLSSLIPFIWQQSVFEVNEMHGWNQSRRQRRGLPEGYCWWMPSCDTRDAGRGKKLGSRGLLAEDTRCTTTRSLLNIEEWAFTRQGKNNILIESLCSSKEKGFVIWLAKTIRFSLLLFTAKESHRRRLYCKCGATKAAAWVLILVLAFAGCQWRC